MCSENCMNQINASIDLLKNATAQAELIAAQTQAQAFIQASFEAKEISKKQKNSFERKVRKIYRNQLIGDAA